MAILITQKDYGYDIDFTIKNSDGTAYVLTGSTLTLYWRHREPPIYNSTDIDNKSGSMSIVSATAGTCKYTVSTGDFNWHGKYTAEIQIKTTSKTITVPNISILVTPRIVQTT